ncbi:MAG: hypothetical protein GC162_11420 [Planctomycetes bacterium]|nr:hypothetical protein [Planctomycetota bacterium]
MMISPLRAADEPGVDADQVSAATALSRGLKSLYGGRGLEFADAIDATSRKAFLDRYTEDMKKLLRQLNDLPESAKMADFVGAKQDALIHVDPGAVVVQGGRAKVLLRFDAAHLEEWLMATEANNTYVRLAMLSIKNGKPAPTAEGIVNRLFAADSPAWADIRKRAQLMREHNINPAPAIVELVRESDGWKLDWGKYQEDVKVLSEKMKSVEGK